MEQEPTIRSLIEAQRRLAESPNAVWRMGTLIVAAVLDRRLADLSDRQVGQLIFDFVVRDLVVGTPAMTVCQHAAVRLIRSDRGRLTAEEIDKQQERPSCPLCGNEMLRHYGIDEPDHWQCISLACGYKREIDDKKEETD